METLDITVEGVRLTPCFQPYLCVADPFTREGELLTRTGAEGPTEAYFSSLGVESQFTILEWQLQVQRLLRESFGTQVSVNVHNRIVESEESRQRFLALLAAADGTMTLEFTETYPMPPVTQSNRLLRHIRELGHSSALDDFGTGLNGMSLLTDYDFDIIKLDQSMVFDLPGRPEKQKTLRLMFEILAVLGKAHVVEGVETQEVLDILKGLGYTTFQGYHFGMPQPVQELLDGLAEERGRCP